MYRQIGIVMIILLVFCLRLWLLPEVPFRQGQTVKITARLAEEPSVFESYQSFELAGARVYTDKLPRFSYGDRLTVVGKVVFKPPKYLTNMAESNFLVRRGIVSAYSLSKPEIVSLGRVVSLTGALGWLKQEVIRTTEKTVPVPLSGILLGITWGDREAIPISFWEKLRQVGVLHIMVASGSNVVFLLQGVVGLLVLAVSRRKALIVGLGVIWAYAVMVGFEAPVVRAAVMLSLVAFSEIVGRGKDTKRVFWLSLALMVFVSPKWLFDIGFQLSAAATGGLVYLGSVFGSKGWRGVVGSSVAAQIATLPLLWQYFGQVNVLTPLVNLLVLWTTPYILSIGMISSLAIWIFGEVGTGVVFLIYPLLWAVEQVVNLFAGFAFLAVRLPDLGWAGVGVGYLIIYVAYKVICKIQIININTR